MRETFSHSLERILLRAIKHAVAVSVLLPIASCANLSDSDLPQDTAGDSLDATSDSDGAQDFQRSARVLASDLIIDPQTGVLIVRNELLVTIQPGVDAAMLHAQLADHALDVVGVLPELGIVQLRATATNQASGEWLEMAAVIEQIPGILAVAPHVIYTEFSGWYPNEGYGRGGFTDDVDALVAWLNPAIQEQTWGLAAISMPAAWQIMRGSGRRLVVVDSGFDSQHPDFIGASGEQLARLVVDNGVGPVRQEHGTHVAGIAAAGLDNQVGIAGVDGGVRLEVYTTVGISSVDSSERIFNWWPDQLVTQMSVLDALSLAMEDEPGAVINISQGIAWQSDTLCDGNLADLCTTSAELCGDPDAASLLRAERLLWRPVFLQARLSDTLLIAAAGNYGDLSAPDCSNTVRFSGGLQNPEPEFQNQVLVVASVGGGSSSRGDFLQAVGAGGARFHEWSPDWQLLSPFTSFGATVDIAAPGAQVMSLCPLSVCPSGLSYQSGTSMAAPFVAGVASLLRGLRPDWTASQIHDHIVLTSEAFGPSAILPGGISDSVASGVHILAAAATLRYVDSPAQCQDTDGDGFGEEDSSGAVGLGCEFRLSDCDDLNSRVFPDADEICNGIDDNCDGRIDENGICYSCGTSDRPVGAPCGTCGDGIWICSETGIECLNAVAVPMPRYRDLDGDGFGDADSSTEVVCSNLTGYANDPDDCDDQNPSINPAAVELAGDGVDNDCDGVSADVPTSGGGGGGGGLGGLERCSSEWENRCLGDTRAVCRLVYPNTSISCVNRNVCELRWVPQTNCEAQFGCTCSMVSGYGLTRAFCLNEVGEVCVRY